MSIFLTEGAWGGQRSISKKKKKKKKKARVAFTHLGNPSPLLRLTHNNMAQNQGTGNLNLRKKEDWALGSLHSSKLGHCERSGGESSVLKSKSREIAASTFLEKKRTEIEDGRRFFAPYLQNYAESDCRLLAIQNRTIEGLDSRRKHLARPRHALDNGGQTQAGSSGVGSPRNAAKPKTDTKAWHLNVVATRPYFVQKQGWRTCVDRNSADALSLRASLLPRQGGGGTDKARKQAVNAIPM